MQAGSRASGANRRRGGSRPPRATCCRSSRRASSSTMCCSRAPTRSRSCTTAAGSRRSVRPRCSMRKRAQQRVAAAHGLRMTVLDARALRAREPGIGDAFCGAFHWQDPKTVSSPGGLTKAYARLFECDGGTFVRGDATTLVQVDDGWQVRTEHGPIAARSAVVALGPWSDQVFAPLGYRIPLRAKRGYHMHYRPTRTPLNVPVCDTEAGFVVAPMEGGRLRLTTGVEIALPDAPPTGVQLARAEPLARDAFGIGERLDPEPWLGMRPCTPDMRPVIGPAPRHRHLWFAFGHCHHGLTLGPATGRLLAEMMTGAPTYIDPHPYRPARFG
ncbi:FAD-binding oxidoreductase [Burkholderia cenocepacia]|nr:FAD-binding oxidoreductase [Burkholderia cenocepacia]